MKAKLFKGGIPGNLVPGGYLLVAIHSNGRFIRDDLGENIQEFLSVCFQTDWDFPALASRFGFVPCCDCTATDGTVDCKHKTASQMISEATEFLDDSEGEILKDASEYF